MEYDKELKYLILVIYDISDNKRRRTFAKQMEKFGTRVQRSSFEMRLNREQMEKMIKGVEKVIAEEDNVRIYKLYGYDEVRVYGEKNYKIGRASCRERVSSPV